MPESRFEYEERYKEVDPLETQRKLKVATFMLRHVETQIDHWFIPNHIMSPDEQGHWFDYERGYALRIREETGGAAPRAIITSKQLLQPADHSAMTNNEEALTAGGMLQVLLPMEDEFAHAISALKRKEDRQVLSFVEAKQLIESSGRKEYIVLEKTRSAYQSEMIPDIEVDMDTIPALQQTTLGFWASVEIEYTGTGSLEEARTKVRDFSSELGYDKKTS